MKSYPVVVLVLAVAARPTFASHAADAVLLTAERDGATGLVRLRAWHHGESVAVPAALELAEWHGFGPRGGARHAPAEAFALREVGAADGLPRLAWDRGTSLLAFTSAVDGTSGLAILDPQGARVIVAGDENRFRPQDAGVAVSWDGERLAIVVRGTRRAEAIVVERVAAGAVDDHASIVVRSLPFADPSLRAVPESIAFAGDAVIVAAEDDANRSSIHRFALPEDRAEAPEDEIVAGPFAEIGSFPAIGPSLVAFLAGADDDAWDVYIVGASGPAVDLTQAPGPYVDHDERDERIAVSRDGARVAYNLDIGGEPEVYLHEVARPGPAGRVHVTRDERFNPYIDQQVFILFDASSQLFFDAGHSPESTDLYRVLPQAGDALDAVNLSRTGSGLEPPFLTRGTLRIGDVVVGPEGLVVFGASGFDGVRPGVVGVSSASGETLFDADGFSAPRDFFALGAKTCFIATATDGGDRLLSVEGGALATVWSGAAGAPAARLVARSRSSAHVVTGDGTLLELTAATDPRVLAERNVLPDLAFVPRAAGAGGTPDTDIVIGRADGAGIAYSRLDVGSAEETPLGTLPSGETLVAAFVLPRVESDFVRGDANRDRLLDLSDAVATLVHLFGGGDVVAHCLDAADVDDDGRVDISDPIRALAHLFLRGPPPLAPYPQAGLDPTPDGLSCFSND